MSRPSPLEHLPRLMAEADKTIAELRTQLADEQTASESLRNQIDVMGKNMLEAGTRYGELEKCLRACEELLKGACEERDDLRRQRNNLEAAVRHGDIALRNAREHVDEMQTRAGRVRRTLQGHYEMGDVDWPALFAELDAISPPQLEQPWLEGSLTIVERETPAGGDHDAWIRERGYDDLSLVVVLTRNLGPRIQIYEHRGLRRHTEHLEPCVLALLQGMARSLLEPKLPAHIVERLAVPDDIHAHVADGLERERIMRPVGEVIDELARGEIRVRAEQLVRIDGVLIRGRRRKDGNGYDHLNVELVDEPVTIGATISTVVDRSSSKDVDVSVEIAGRKLELGPPISGRRIESPPGWMDNADLRELVEAMQTTLREQPAAVYMTLPRESVELIVRVATVPVMRAPRSSAELEQLKAGAREQIASGALNVITTDDGDHDVRELPPCPSCSKPALAIDRIGSSFRRVNDENGMPGHAVRINTPGLVRHADGTTCQVPSFDAAAPAMREAFERVRVRSTMRDRIGRRLFGDDAVAATAATLLLELVQTLRARLSHASTELRHRSEPAPEVDDVGAACAVLAEDLDGIIAEVDHVLEQVPR